METCHNVGENMRVFCIVLNKIGYLGGGGGCELTPGKHLHCFFMFDII